MSEAISYEHVVQYYETDQMGIAHHSNYIRWFEEARIHFFDEIGLGYKESEKMGIISPVLAVEANYKNMSYFQDTVVISVRLTDYSGVRLSLSYEVTDKATGQLRCTGKSKHCFINPEGNVISLKKVAPDRYNTLIKMLEDDNG
ncbi:MAG: acyl-CoA thioesterase [Saccharofermentans sp.]|nr:acyl-CoA thioesterase [Saccharofermentans sp.]